MASISSRVTKKSMGRLGDVETVFTSIRNVLVACEDFFGGAGGGSVFTKILLVSGFLTWTMSVATFFSLTLTRSVLTDMSTFAGATGVILIKTSSGLGRKFLV